MIKQHFYSRVPSKIAMFYKMNGFDTFACSDGIGEDLIEKELNIVLDQKLTPLEYSEIRKNPQDPLFASFMISSGEVVESCVSYLKDDYSGERSTYMVHSLLFDNEGQKIIHGYKNSVAIDPDNFKKDLSSFDITGAKAKPIKNYPELPLKMPKFVSNDLSSFINGYDHVLVKKLIAGIILAVSGKIKCVHVILPDNNIEKTINFFNDLIQVFPFHYRKYVSFAGILNDINRFSGFKLKVIKESLGNAPMSKGCTINFKTKETFALKDNDVKLVATTAEFLYYLLSHKDERYEMLDFIDFAFKRRTEKDNPSDLKSLNNLLFLFRAGSEFYEEQIILPNDDSIIALFDNYIEYQKQMPDEYKMNIIKRLRRYPSYILPIPKVVFNKYTKVYREDSVGCRHIFMNICLDLIHTDAMRPQLFAFIKANYFYEDKETQAAIMKNLARVYNGEFLQEEIIEFFGKNFLKTDVETREVVLNAILLSARTPAIQDKMFEFVTTHYNKLLTSEKILLYKMVAEHLPEGDELSRKLLGVVDSYIKKEDPSIEKQYTRSLNALLLNEQALNKNQLLAIVSETCGFTFDFISKAIFTKWRDRKICRQFIVLSCRGTLISRTNRIVKMWRVSSKDIEDDLTKKFYNSVVKGFEDYPCQTTVDEFFASKEAIEVGLRTAMRLKRCEVFVGKYVLTILNSLFTKYLLTAFVSKEPGCIEKTVNYINANVIFEGIPNVEYLNYYLGLKNAIQTGNVIDVFSNLAKIGKHDELNKRIAAYMQLDVFAQMTEDKVYTLPYFLYQAASNYLRSYKIKIGTIFDVFMDEINNKYTEDNSENCKQIIQKYSAQMFGYVVLISDTILADSNLAEIYKDDLSSYDTGYTPAAQYIFVNYGRGQFNECVSFYDNKSKETKKLLEAAIKKSKTKAGLFAKVVRLS